MVNHEILSQEEIEKILSQIGKKKEFTQLKPSEIEQEKDIVERQKNKIRFNTIKEVYITPLERLLEFNYSRLKQDNYSINLTDLSLEECMNTLSKHLLKYGYNDNQLKEFLPRTEEELDLIITAKEQGFRDNALLTNKERLNNAQEYLNNLSKGPRL